MAPHHFNTRHKVQIHVINLETTFSCLSTLPAALRPGSGRQRNATKPTSGEEIFRGIRLSDEINSLSLNFAVLTFEPSSVEAANETCFRNLSPFPTNFPISSDSFEHFAGFILRCDLSSLLNLFYLFRYFKYKYF